MNVDLLVVTFVMWLHSGRQWQPPKLILKPVFVQVARI